MVKELAPSSTAWTPAKVKAFRAAFMNFLQHVKIDSKETGGDTVLGDHIYGAQKRFLDCIFEGLAEDIHDFKILKSRQLGITTVSRALTLFWLGMHPGLKGSMVFDTISHRDEARNEFVTMLKNLPDHLKFPKLVKDGRDLLSLTNGSTFVFLSAGVRKSKASGTLGRSSGLNFVHASEMCSWENEEGVVSFRNSLSENFANRLYIWESTARGFNQWYRMWQEAKNDNLNQKTCFIGWWAKDSQQIQRGTPMFAKYGEEPPTPEELAKMQEVEQRYGHKITQEQLAWYRRKSRPVQKEGDDDGDDTVEELMQQEQPWTEDDAFLQSGSTFFSGEKLTHISKYDVSDKYKSYWFSQGSEFIDCDWHPSARKRDTHLKVWEEPDPDGYYMVSADPAYGHDENNNHSAIQVLRCYADCVEQVAEYANSSIQTQPFAWVIASLAGWYKNTHMILEINGPGEAVWNEYKSLKQLVLSGHLKSRALEKGLRDIFTNVHDYMYVRSDSNAGTSGTLHWKTTTQLKVAIMERLRDFVSNGTLKVRSLETVEEMKTIIRNGDTIGSEGRNRDDRTFCFAMGIRGWENAVRRMLSIQGRTKEAEAAKKRLTVKDQITMFNKHKLDSFFKGKKSERSATQAQVRRLSWRGK